MPLNQLLWLRGIGFFSNALSLVMPRKAKRAVFLTNVFFEVAEVSKTNKLLVIDLNLKLHLSSDPTALHAITQIAETLTRDQRLLLRDIREGMSDEEINGICLRILATRNRWSRYSDDFNQIYSETLTVIRQAILYQGRSYSK